MRRGAGALGHWRVQVEQLHPGGAQPLRHHAQQAQQDGHTKVRMLLEAFQQLATLEGQRGDRPQGAWRSGTGSAP